MAKNERGAMAFGGPSRRRSRFRPGAERLEGRALLAQAINLAGVSTVPYGIQQINQLNSQGAGYSAAIVGDVNRDGFVDMVVGAPFIESAPGRPVLSSGNGLVYLIFGSQQVNLDGTRSNVNWRDLVAQQRTGEFAQLGNTTQTNPINNQTGFSFNGVSFTANQDPSNNFGAAVAPAGDVNNDGFADFLIGAPGARDTNSNVPGIGRAYLVYGLATIDRLSSNVVDLSASDPTNGPVQFLVLANSPTQLLSATGTSVGAVGDINGDNFVDIAVGAPFADFAGGVDNGAVYVVSGAFLRPAPGNPPRTGILDLSTVGGTTPGIIFTGPNSDDRVGSSLSFGGDFNGDNISDILIGGTQGTGGGGVAAVVYGSVGLTGQISLGGLVSGALPGAIFTGSGAGDRTGQAVAPAGDFNGDGVSDIVIGSPGWDGPAGADSGLVSIIYGSTNDITGVLQLASLPSSVRATQIFGPAAVANLGHALSPLASINLDTLPELLIGAPGLAANRGAVYLVPGNRNAVGTFTLNPAGLDSLFVTTMNLPSNQNYLGSSVSGQLFFNTSNSNTIDADGDADMAVGAAGFAFGNATLAGTAYALEGFFIPLETPPNQPPPAEVVSNIAVNTTSPPFVINLQTDTTVTIYILSGGSNTPGFAPFADIDPNTIQVNGVNLPDPSSFENAGDIDGDGIDDAVFLFDPLSALGLSLGTQTLTVSALTDNNETYSGSAQVQVINPGTDGGTGTLPLTFGPLFQNRNLAAPQWGERFLPVRQQLQRSRWSGISPRLAYRQFVPQGAFGFRMRNYFHRDAQMNEPKGRTRTLGREVFTRGRFKPGVHFGSINHNGPVIGNGVHLGHNAARQAQSR